MPKSHTLSTILLSGLLSITLPLASCTQAPESAQSTQHKGYAKLEGQTMGTSYHITFKNDGLNIQHIQEQIDARLLSINKSMSTYDDSATIMTFNRAKAGEVISIDDDFKKVLADSRTIHLASGGSFDPTVMPLVSLWGFGKELTAERLANPPSSQDIENTKNLIGLDKVIDVEGGISKTMDGVALDFSAIAKGYGVDVIAQVLADNGIRDYMVEIGGEIATQGKNPEGKAWTIGIDMPTINSTVQTREILTALPLGNDHMATSGSYRNFLTYNNVLYSHTIDPTTAAPVVDSAVSITVLADSTALADGWATALSAMPMNRAIEVANAQNLVALFIGHKDSQQSGEYRIVPSNAFAQKFSQLNLPNEK